MNRTPSFRGLAQLAARALPALLLVVSLAAETSPRLNPQDRAKMFQEMIELMEAASLVMPELSRAGAPLIENVKSAARTLEYGPVREDMGVTYRLLQNARIFLQIADALPKPPSLSAEVRSQFDRLRAHVDNTEVYFRQLLDLRQDDLRGSDRDNLSRYEEDNRRLGPPAAGDKRVVFLGDSITDGWELNQYFPGKPYINRGISGQITGQMLGRMKADVLDLNPRAMVLLGGTNDLARGVSSETIKSNIVMIAELAEAHDITPILASILPVSDYHGDEDPRYKRSPARPPSEILNLNAWLKEFCAKNDYLYLDYHANTRDGSGQLRAELAADGLHPNAEGYKIMAPLAQAAIDRALTAKAPEPQKKKRFGVF